MGIDFCVADQRRLLLSILKSFPEVSLTNEYPIHLVRIVLELQDKTCALNWFILFKTRPNPTTTIESRKFRIPSAGRLWLDAIPSSTSLTLSDDDITANLHYRTPLAGHSGTCSACAAPNLSLHDEGCPGGQDFRVSCHDSVKHILAAGLRQIPQMQVEVEPFLPDLRRRNDIRVHAVSDLHADLHEEYDPKVMVLRAASNQRSLATANVATADTSIFKQTAERVQILLTRNAKKKVSAVTVD